MTTQYTRIMGIAAKDGSGAENAVRARYSTSASNILLSPDVQPGYVDGDGALWHYIEIASTPELVSAVQGISNSPQINVGIVAELMTAEEAAGLEMRWVAGGLAMVDTGERANLLLGLTPVVVEDI